MAKLSHCQLDAGRVCIRNAQPALFACNTCGGPLADGGGAGAARHAWRNARQPVSFEVLFPCLQVKTVEQYELYCHYVAGLVGIGLSQLFASSGEV